MTWPAALISFRAYLLLERSLSPHTLDAYLNDVKKFVRFLEIEQRDLLPLAVRPADLEQFILWINQLGLEASSQARLLAGLQLRRRGPGVLVVVHPTGGLGLVVEAAHGNTCALEGFPDGSCIGLAK